MRRQYFAKRVFQVVVVEENAHVLVGRVILRHGDVVEIQRPHAIFRKGGLRQREGNLAAAVGAEIEAEDNVAVLHRGQRLVVGVAEDDWLDKLVGGACGVGGADGVFGVGGVGSCAAHQKVVGQANALPALVTVHGVVASTDACNEAAGLLQVVLQRMDKVDSAVWVRIAAIGEGVDGHARHAGSGGVGAQAFRCSRLLCTPPLLTKPIR